jgi:predicted glycosyltransferase
VPPRILFHVPSRRGLGHVMRSANLARAVVAADPLATTLVHVATPAASVACGTDVPWLAQEVTTAGAWARLVSAFRPSLVVFDTVLPGAWSDDATPRAFVWRRTVEARHADALADPRLSSMRLIVVPHDRGEFGRRLPAALDARAVFAGPIVRTTDADGQARVGRRYGLTDDDTVITSTVGGGGFAASARWVLDMVVAAHARLHARLPRLRHVVVRGPLGPRSPEPAAPGLTVVDADPDLVHLMALSHLVVAEAGYNTVNELRLAGVPAFLVPGARRYDDQQARAVELARLGIAYVVSRDSADAAIERLIALATNREALDAMRAASRRHRVPTGNAIAAAALLEAAQ